MKPPPAAGPDLPHPGPGDPAGEVGEGSSAVLIPGVPEAARRRGRMRDGPGRWVERVGRGGLGAYGAVHLIVAVLAVRIALLGGRAHVDQRGAVAIIASEGLLGRVLLVIAVIALSAFAVWPLRAATVGYRWVPDRGQRWRKRGGALAKAGGVLSVAWGAARFAVRNPSDRRDVRVLCEQLFAVPGGRLLVGAVGLVVLVMAAVMAFTGIRRTFLSDLVLDRLHPGLHRSATVLGATGNLTRAATFATIGVLTMIAVIANTPDSIGGLDLALRTLADNSAGILVLLAAAAGFGAYGGYCLLDAWARHP